jgi:hypothetical protein
LSRAGDDVAEWSDTVLTSDLLPFSARLGSHNATMILSPSTSEY